MSIFPEFFKELQKESVTEEEGQTFKLGDILVQTEHPEYGSFKVTGVKDYGYEVTRVGARSASDSTVLHKGEERFWRLAGA